MTTHSVMSPCSFRVTATGAALTQQKVSIRQAFDKQGQKGRSQIVSDEQFI